VSACVLRMHVLFVCYVCVLRGMEGERDADTRG